MKKIIGAILSVVLLIGTVPMACASTVNSDLEPLHSVYATPVFNEYQNEISEIEAEYGVVIDQINRVTLGYIQNAAVEYYGVRTRYADLVDEIVLAYCDQSVLGTPDEIQPLVNEPTEVRNYKREIIEEFGPCSGQLMDAAAVGLDVSQEKSFTFTLSGKYRGATLSGSFSIKDGYVLKGPDRGSKLNDGKEADGCFLFAVMYGTYVHTTWDVYEINTGKRISHIDSYSIDAERDNNGNPTYRQYTPCYAEITTDDGPKIYIDAGLNNLSTVGEWDDRTTLVAQIREYPELMLNGTGQQEE